MKTIFQQLLILYVFLFLGWLIGKCKKKQAGHVDILSVLLVNILLPCKIFKTFSGQFTVSYFLEKYPYLLASLALLAVLLVVAHFVSRLLGRTAYERRVYSYSCIITNYGYLGYALIEAVFGEVMLAAFMFFAVPFVTYTYTAGYVLLTGGDKPMKKLCNPITAAIVLGAIFGLVGLPLPAVADSVLSMGSACVGPLCMLLTGITLSTFALKELLTEKTAYIFCALRLVVIPAAAYGVCRLLHLDFVLPMVLIITAMPCGLNAIVFPKLIGENCKPGARLALLTHVFSLITLPFWLSLIQI